MIELALSVRPSVRPSVSLCMWLNDARYTHKVCVEDEHACQSYAFDWHTCRPHNSRSNLLTTWCTHSLVITSALESSSASIIARRLSCLSRNKKNCPTSVVLSSQFVSFLLKPRVRLYPEIFSRSGASGQTSWTRRVGSSSLHSTLFNRRSGMSSRKRNLILDGSILGVYFPH